MLNDILSVAKAFFGLEQYFKEAEKRRREQISSYFWTIAETTKEVSNTLKSNEIPYGACSKMWTLTEQLPHCIEDVVSPEKTEELFNMLMRAYGEGMELWYSELSENKEELKTIEEAVGIFENLSESIKAVP